MNSVENSSYIKECLERDGAVVTVTCGVSMRPLFKSGRDTVVLKAIFEDLKKRDVVLYPVGGGFVMHRIVGIKKDGNLVIRGDNTYRNELVPKDRVIARLESFTRGGKEGRVTDRGYRIYSFLWCFIYPIRKIYHSIRRLGGKILRKLKIKK